MSDRLRYLKIKMRESIQLHNQFQDNKPILMENIIRHQKNYIEELELEIERLTSELNQYDV